MSRPSLIVGLAALLIAAGATMASAQRRSPAELEQQIAAIEKQLAELAEAAVQVPTVAEGVRSLSEQLAVLKQRVDTLSTEQRSIPDAIAVLDELSQRTGTLESEVAALRTRVAGLDQPSVGAASGGGGVRYDRGFVISTDDGAYSLTLDGYMQTRYQLVVDEDWGDIISQGLRIRRARLGASGTIVSPNLSFRVLTELTATPPLMDYYLTYQVWPELGVRAGQYKVWFSRNYITSSTRLILPERQAAVESFRYDRDAQVGLLGELASERISYYVGIGNGGGLNQRNDNIDILVLARADVAILGERIGYDYGDLIRSSSPRLTVGAAVIHDLVAVPDEIGGFALVTDVDGMDGRDNVQVISATADAVLRYRGIEVSLEWLLRREDWGTILEGQANPGADLADVVGTESTRTHHAVAGHVAYAVRPEQLLVAVGASYGDVPFLGIGGLPSELELGRQRLELDGVVQLYDAKGRLLGLQYTLTDFGELYDPADASADTTHRLILEAQLKF
ncbi:MAG TPA: porin [Kofleriaceae bacterium]|nr:porin [Kofleriaceae bacterium]